MSRSYVAIYQNKESNYFLYFDFKKHELFTVKERKNQSKIILTSFVSIVFYVVMKSVSFNITINPLKILFITSILGIILGFISIKLTNRSINAGLERRKEVIYPTNQELREYLVEGKKQAPTLFFVLLLLFFLVILSAGFLYFMPQSLLMILVNIGFWTLSILFTWATRPIKRKQIHKQLNNKLEKHSG